VLDADLGFAALNPSRVSTTLGAQNRENCQMNQNGISTYSISLPIHRAKELPGDRYFVTGEIIGTCFSIGNDFMLTANHVIDALESLDIVGVVGIANPDDDFLKGARIVEFERLACDVGVIKVTHVFPESAKWVHTLPWNQATLSAFDEVKSLGYPYGLHNIDEKKSIVQRAFQGHIVSALNEFKPISYKGRPFAVYELSFQAPRGLSGSPLIITRDTISISGMIIGNSKTSMLVLETEEIGESSSEKIVIQQYESLSLGIAIQAKEIFQQKSTLLGDAIFEFLGQNGSLV